MTKTIKETLEFIEHVCLSLEASYSHIYDKTKEVLDGSKLSNADRSHLEWGLAHMYKSKEEFMRDLDRHVDTLKHELEKETNAGQSIQNHLR